MLSLVTTVPVTLLILGPLGFEMGSLLTQLILWMHGKFGFIATGLLAGGLPFIVAAGMHKPFLPYAIMSMGQTGKESLYNPASLAHNIAEAGACFAVSLKSKIKCLKVLHFPPESQPSLVLLNLHCMVLLYSIGLCLFR